MFITPLLFILLLPFGCLAAPTPAQAPRSEEEPMAIYTVSQFTAWVSFDPSVPSYTMFNLHDPRPEYNLDVECYAIDDIYRPVFTECGNTTEDAKFRLTEGDLEIQRGYQQGRSYIRTWAPQGTYWQEGDDGNATRIDSGILYTRTADWYFPVTSASMNV